uniref:Roc domain-containing protein n=1 Tax=Macrostomum lignano TaxID=282301 RepID=A0A1I8G680_9PLAT
LSRAVLLLSTSSPAHPYLDNAVPQWLQDAAGGAEASPQASPPSGGCCWHNAGNGFVDLVGLRLADSPNSNASIWAFNCIAKLPGQYRKPDQTHRPPAAWQPPWMTLPKSLCSLGDQLQIQTLDLTGNRLTFNHAEMAGLAGLDQSATSLGGAVQARPLQAFTLNPLSAAAHGHPERPKLRPCKLVFLGDLGSGKTSLARLLRLGHAAPTKSDGSGLTRGFQLSSWRSENRCPFVLLEAGGHPIYAPLLAKLLDPKALHCVVFDIAEYQQIGFDVVSRWLRLLAAHLPGARSRRLWLRSRRPRPRCSAFGTAWTRIWRAASSSFERTRIPSCGFSPDPPGVGGGPAAQPDLLTLRDDLERLSTNREAMPHLQKYVPTNWQPFMEQVKQQDGLYIEWDWLVEFADQRNIRDAQLIDCLEFYHESGQLLQAGRLSRRLLPAAWPTFLSTTTRNALFRACGRMSAAEYEEAREAALSRGQLSWPLVRCLAFGRGGQRQALVEALHCLELLELACCTMPPQVPQPGLHSRPVLTVPHLMPEPLPDSEDDFAATWRSVSAGCPQTGRASLRACPAGRPAPPALFACLSAAIHSAISWRIDWRQSRLICELDHCLLAAVEVDGDEADLSSGLDFELASQSAVKLQSGFDWLPTMSMVSASSRPELSGDLRAAELAPPTRVLVDRRVATSAAESDGKFRQFRHQPGLRGRRSAGDSRRDLAAAQLGVGQQEGLPGCQRLPAGCGASFSCRSTSTIIDVAGLGRNSPGSQVAQSSNPLCRPARAQQRQVKLDREAQLKVVQEFAVVRDANGRRGQEGASSLTAAAAAAFEVAQNPQLAVGVDEVQLLAEVGGPDRLQVGRSRVCRISGDSLGQVVPDGGSQRSPASEARTHHRLLSNQCLSGEEPAQLRIERGQLDQRVHEAVRHQHVGVKPGSQAEQSGESPSATDQKSAVPTFGPGRIRWEQLVAESFPSVSAGASGVGEEVAGFFKADDFRLLLLLVVGGVSQKAAGVAMEIGHLRGQVRLWCGMPLSIRLNADFTSCTRLSASISGEISGAAGRRIHGSGPPPCWSPTEPRQADLDGNRHAVRRQLRQSLLVGEPVAPGEGALAEEADRGEPATSRPAELAPQRLQRKGGPGGGAGSTEIRQRRQPGGLVGIDAKQQALLQQRGHAPVPISGRRAGRLAPAQGRRVRVAAAGELLEAAATAAAARIGAEVGQASQLGAVGFNVAGLRRGCRGQQGCRGGRRRLRNSGRRGGGLHVEKCHDAEAGDEAAEQDSENGRGGRTGPSAIGRLAAALHLQFPVPISDAVAMLVDEPVGDAAVRQFESSFSEASTSSASTRCGGDEAMEAVALSSFIAIHWLLDGCPMGASRGCNPIWAIRPKLLEAGGCG